MPVSLRQIRGQRAEAQKLLERLLFRMRIHTPLDTATHFREEFSRIKVRGQEVPGRRQNIDVTAFNDAVWRILVTTASGAPAVERDLAVLAAAVVRVGSGILGIAYDAQDGYRFRPDELGYERQVTELLLQYLNLTRQCGPLHAVCEIPSCGHLMMRGRGAKKFCSQECRQNFWSYEQQKMYYQQRLATTRQSPGAKKKKSLKRRASKWQEG